MFLLGHDRLPFGNLVLASPRPNPSLGMGAGSDTSRFLHHSWNHWHSSSACHPGPNPTKKGREITDADRAYWAYQPVKRPDVPKVKNTAWVRNPIDAFILAGLEAKGLEPTSPAERLALCRRVYYDLIGLPPTPAEIDAFVN